MFVMHYAHSKAGNGKEKNSLAPDEKREFFVRAMFIGIMSRVPPAREAPLRCLGRTTGDHVYQEEHHGRHQQQMNKRAAQMDHQSDKP
jgi:hypothetical protein